MQRMEIPDYVNEKPRHGQKRSRNANQTERRIIQLLVFGFGLLCILQAILNVSLRLALHSSKESAPSDCNTTHFRDQKIEALIRNRTILENKNVELNNMIKTEKEKRERLEMQLRVHSSKESAPSDCNTTHFKDQNQIQRPGHCSTLTEKVEALIRDRTQLENKNAELNNMIKMEKEKRNRLEMQLRELSGCVSSQQCPREWRNINSRCYFLSSESKTWEESRKYCQSRGADLVVIKSEEEQRAIYRLNGEAVLLFWIGLSGTDGTFKWVDESALTKSFWQSGQPDHGGPNNKEDCVEMYHFNPELANWNDAPCGKTQRWLCEKDPCTSS